MNSLVEIDGCINRGKITGNDEVASDCRPAGIVSAMGNNTKITNCTNYGDVVYAVANSTKGLAAGIVGQTNDGKKFTVIEGCANYGAILSDMFKHPDSDYSVVTITADNFEQYICMEPDARKANVTFEGNVFGSL